MLDIENKSKVFDERIKSEANLINKAKSDIEKNYFEKLIVYLYPFFLAAAVSFRMTMTSAEVFDWYQKDNVPKANGPAQKFDADKSVEGLTAQYESIENNGDEEDTESLKPLA
ncbi:hypothetical protein D3C85_1422540 [compost metagenome]